MECMDSDNSRTGYEYETLMNLLQVSVSKHLLDEHFTLVWANDYYYDMIGYTKEEYENIYHNRPDLYYINEEMGIHDEEQWNQIGQVVVETMQAGKDGYTIISRMRKAGGDYIWARMTARFTNEYIGGYQVSYTAMTDVSDIIQMQKEQSVTYDNLPGFVAKYRVGPDLSFTLLEANERFFAFFGQDSWKNDDYPLYRQNVASNMTVFLEHKDALTTGAPVHFTVQMQDQHGKDAWLQINASCVGYEEGEPVYLAVYIDVTNETQLRQMQRQLRSALSQAEEASRAKSDFLSRMSHDIRTPMNAILGMKDIAAAHLDDKEKVKDCLKKIGLSGQHLLGLINDVLDMSKIESGEMTLREDVVSLPQVLQNIVTIMQPQFRGKNQQFSIKLRCVTHERFFSDSLRLQQVFLNILSNACKFTPDNGKISMEVQELSAKEGVSRFSFTISDTGIGMQPEFVSHIFTAFSREHDSRVDKIEGTGLGMAITKKIVDFMGGTVEVQSTPGEGTAFCVTLPLKIEESPVDAVLPDLRILIADDDAIMCGYTLEILDSMGIHAHWVSSGEEALESILEAQKARQPYDAVLLDWKMPGQDGLETTLRIREVCGDGLPILIISAYDWSDIEQDARKAGITGFLQKPIFVSTLVQGLRRYVLKNMGEQEDRKENRKSVLCGKRFLLVEDNVLNQEVATELLSDLGAKVEIAGDGKKGVALFEHSQPGYYDMVLMDIRMPVMDGYTAARAIRSLRRGDAVDVPILALTADAFAEDILEAKKAGMNGHMAKPLDAQTLKREIIKYL